MVMRIFFFLLEFVLLYLRHAAGEFTALTSLVFTLCHKNTPARVSFNVLLALLVLVSIKMVAKRWAISRQALTNYVLNTLMVLFVLGSAAWSMEVKHWFRPEPMPYKALPPPVPIFNRRGQLVGPREILVIRVRRHHPLALRKASLPAGKIPSDTEPFYDFHPEEKGTPTPERPPAKPALAVDREDVRKRADALMRQLFLTNVPDLDSCSVYLHYGPKALAEHAPVINALMEGLDFKCKVIRVLEPDDRHIDGDLLGVSFGDVNEENEMVADLISKSLVSTGLRSQLGMKQRSSRYGDALDMYIW